MKNLYNTYKEIKNNLYIIYLSSNEYINWLNNLHANLHTT